jgi:prevent-host-death family protein
MKTINFTEFRKKASGLLNEVEQGEQLLLTRHGKPIAEVIPPRRKIKEDASWKQPFTPLEINNLNLSKAILEEREDEK